MTGVARLVRVLLSARSGLADLIAPTCCPICELDAQGPPICSDCRAELVGAAGLACPRCALPVGPWADLRGGCCDCRRKKLGFDAAIALGPYSGPIRELCLRLKHLQNAWLARWLADLLVIARAGDFHAEELDGPTPLVVPVPLHWTRRLSRGYNQAEALADALAKALGLPSAQPLRRIKGAARLAGAGRLERASRLKGAFSCREDERLAGRTVLLVDDVLTTGATCGSAARALKKAGAARVVAVVIARAEGRG